MSIIGTSAGEYTQRVASRIEQSPYKNRIVRKEKQSHERLKDILKNQHLFLFPSVEKREGHSNALNEAMAWGVVPVVSNNNFLSSIVGDNSLVVSELVVDSYVSVIMRLIQNPLLLKQKSQWVYERVKANFTQSMVEGNLQKEIEKIIDNH